MPGKSFGNYRIRAHLGKGGMGDVDRARDARLDRDVAIKTLPPEFTSDADRLERFEREAKLLASLNHPNIAAIYGLEEALVFADFLDEPPGNHPIAVAFASVHGHLATTTYTIPNR